MAKSADFFVATDKFPTVRASVAEVVDAEVRRPE